MRDLEADLPEATRSALLGELEAASQPRRQKRLWKVTWTVTTGRKRGHNDSALIESNVRPQHSDVVRLAAKQPGVRREDVKVQHIRRARP